MRLPFGLHSWYLHAALAAVACRYEMQQGAAIIERTLSVSLTN